MKDILNKPSLVVIIDCWNHLTGPDIPAMMYNIKSFCYDNQNINAVVLATYVDCYGHKIYKDEPWYSIGKELFCNTVSWDLLRRDWNNIEVLGGTITHNVIRNMHIRNDQVQFSMLNGLQLAYYCNAINTSIENIFIVGTAWDICLKDRPLGWREISAINQSNVFNHKKNIFSKLSCVVDGNGKFVSTVSKEWINVDNDIFLLDENSYCG